MMLASRVPYLEIITRLGKPFVAEYKLDGERLQIHKQGENVILFSRRLLKISDQYPDVCQVIKENINIFEFAIETIPQLSYPRYSKRFIPSNTFFPMSKFCWLVIIPNMPQHIILN